MYIIVRCPSCGDLILAKKIHKTRSCPHCGHRSSLHGLRVLGRTDSSREAVLLIQAMKEKEAKSKRG